VKYSVVPKKRGKRSTIKQIAQLDRDWTNRIAPALTIIKRSSEPKGTGHGQFKSGER